MYNGHKNRNHWNVALWIANDYSLYQFAKECIKCQPTKDDAAKRMMQELSGTRTPDGIPYSYSSVRAALVDLD